MALRRLQAHRCQLKMTPCNNLTVSEDSTLALAAGG